MSCRTTPAGSLATTYIQRLFHLEDAMCTSLFHELRRDRGNRVPSTNAEIQDYWATLDVMSSTIATDEAWSPAMRARALRRVSAVNNAPVPDPAVVSAMINIQSRANQAELVLGSFIALTARDNNLTPEEVGLEFRRVYSTYSDAASLGTATQYILSGLSGAPQDTATQYTLGVLSAQNRCVDCGQFIGGTPHTCPTGTVPVADMVAPRRGSRTRTRVNELREESPLSSWEEEVLSAYARDEENVEVSDLNEMSDSLGNTSSDPNVPVSPYTRRAVKPWNMEKFQEVYDEVKEKIDSGSYKVPAFVNPAPGEVTGGLGSRDGGNSFGLELEIDFPDDDYPYDARQRFAAKLYREGIVAQPRVERWHFVGDARPGGNFIESPDGWICEFDRSVDDVDGERGVEIKSQILYDEPKTWSNLNRICEIAREFGGEATPRTGLHVNVGGSKFSKSDPKAHNALLRLAGAYDDTLVRLAHNPESGIKHRGRRHCQMASVPPGGFTEVATAKSYSNHYQAFNLNHLPERGQRSRNSSRVEVRVWDSTLDPGRIQAAVTTSLALVKLAHRDTPPGQEAEPSGTHLAQFGKNRQKGEEWEEATGSFRRFVSLIEKVGGKSDITRRALTTMFAESRWQDR